MDHEKDFLLIIDGSSLLSTQFYGNLPRGVLFAKTVEEKEKYFHKIMQNSKGVYTNAVYGFFRTLLRIMKEQKPSHLVVTWDISRNTFRRKLYPEYKAQRSETMLPLKEQFELLYEVLEKPLLNETTFQEAKRILKEKFERLLDTPSSYASKSPVVSLEVKYFNRDLISS